uniref:Odorant receptor n=1 Tax=Eucryptorrhynchus scrobiculatus TaxID=1552824 RepID=A0A8F4MYU2_EUCSC|nr:odorant receptor 26 [Eucryptorrhynchus scrobiculatus]
MKPEGHSSNYHMSYGKQYMTLLGLWPVTYTEVKKTLYDYYFKVSFAYYCIFVITQLIDAAINLQRSLDAFAAGIGVTLGYATCVLKVHIIKSDKFVNIIYFIEKNEQEITKSYDENIIEIYKKSDRFSKKFEIFFLTFVLTGATLYCTEPVIEEIMQFQNTTGNTTHNVIVSSWFPFDKNEHYLIVYTIQFVACIYGTGYIFFTQAFYFSILRYIVGQLEIICYLFKNFSETSHMFMAVKHLAPTEKSQELFLKTLIQKHQRCIRLVEEVNTCLKTVILLDFGISSFQLAMIVYQLLHLSGFKQFALFTFFLATNIQLCFLYWNGNEIFYKSQEIAMSIQESDWNTYPTKLVKMMLFVIVRAQKPVRLNIGPMGNVQLSALFQIYKAIYSYLCLVLNTE